MLCSASVTGGRFAETDYYATGSGGKDARSSLKKSFRHTGFERESAIEIRAVDGAAPPPDDIPRRRVWMGLRGVMPEDPVLHAALLTYASDRGFIATAHAGMSNRRHRPGAGMGSSASLDHAIWFHRPPRFDDWLLFTSESPVAHAARTLILGQVYRRDGVQVASVVQEALIREPRSP